MNSHQQSEMPTECSGCGAFFDTNAQFVDHIKVPKFVKDY